jgi:hypothetical protein
MMTRHPNSNKLEESDSPSSQQHRGSPRCFGFKAPEVDKPYYVGDSAIRSMPASIGRLGDPEVLRDFIGVSGETDHPGCFVIQDNFAAAPTPFSSRVEHLLWALGESDSSRSSCGMDPGADGLPDSQKPA